MARRAARWVGAAVSAWLRSRYRSEAVERLADGPLFDAVWARGDLILARITGRTLFVLADARGVDQVPGALAGMPVPHEAVVVVGLDKLRSVTTRQLAPLVERHLDIDPRRGVLTLCDRSRSRVLDRMPCPREPWGARASAGLT